MVFPWCPHCGISSQGIELCPPCSKKSQRGRGRCAEPGPAATALKPVAAAQRGGRSEGNKGEGWAETHRDVSQGPGLLVFLRDAKRIQLLREISFLNLGNSPIIHLFLKHSVQAEHGAYPQCQFATVIADVYQSENRCELGQVGRHRGLPGGENLRGLEGQEGWDRSSLGTQHGPMKVEAEV